MDELVVVAPSRLGQRQAEEAFDRAEPYQIVRIPALNGALFAHIWGFWAKRLVQKYGITQVFHAQWQTANPSIALHQGQHISSFFIALHGRELLFNPFAGFVGLRNWYSHQMAKTLSTAHHIFSNSHYSASLVDQAGIQT
ncbi:hypothetical protein RZS08_22740, partial [Arthrospira platensis SPKY1]|nr:hypothetical protein [Arthrospira platensis SPKY1]